MGAGRPSKYSKEMCDRICELIATSEKGLHTICKENPDLPHFSTIMNWLGDEDKKEFLDKYARAREAQADYVFEQIRIIADHADEDHTPFTGGNVVQRDKLRVDARKWIASKLAPKKYGDKIEVDGNIKGSVNEDVLAAIADKINSNSKS